MQQFTATIAIVHYYCLLSFAVVAAQHLVFDYFVERVY